MLKKTIRRLNLLLILIVILLLVAGLKGYQLPKVIEKPVHPTTVVPSVMKDTNYF